MIFLCDRKVVSCWKKMPGEQERKKREKQVKNRKGLKLTKVKVLCYLSRYVYNFFGQGDILFYIKNTYQLFAFERDHTFRRLHTLEWGCVNRKLAVLCFGGGVVVGMSVVLVVVYYVRLPQCFPAWWLCCSSSNHIL